MIKFEKDGWFDAKENPPIQSGHYEVIDIRGEHAFDDYSVDKKIWWNSIPVLWRKIKND